MSHSDTGLLMVRIRIHLYDLLILKLGASYLCVISRYSLLLMQEDGRHYFSRADGELPIAIKYCSCSNRTAHLLQREVVYWLLLGMLFSRRRRCGWTQTRTVLSL